MRWNFSAGINKTKLTSLLLFLFSTQLCHSATVLHVDLDEMLQNSEFVFEGRAINIETVRGQNINQTKTEVEFQILDIIKGDYPGETIKIRFAGGTVDGVTLRISGLHYPRLDETGIYFVETLSRDLVHPFYGWSQGHFLVTEQGTITTRGAVPVVDIVDTKTSGASSGITDGDGVARGVIIQSSTTPGGGISRSQFKEKLKAMITN